jgi:Peptidase family M28
VTDYGALLRELAVPRLVGTPNHGRVRDILKRELTARGFTVEEHAFSGRPSRMLLGTPALVRGVNLIAYRPSARPPVRPSVWLTAHYDSKGQPISMATRLLGAAAVVLGIAGLLVALAIGATLVPGIALIVAGGVVLSRNRVTDGSPGAVDNASGVLAALATVDRLPRDAPLGLILPDAEELGLVGARALVRERPDLLHGTAIVNFDGLDDDGRSIVLAHRAGPLARVLAHELGGRSAPWLPVIVDGIELAGLAQECITVMKGGWGTARRVHTPRDTADRLTLAGMRDVAAVVARVLESEPAYLGHPTLKSGPGEALRL